MVKLELWPANDSLLQVSPIPPPTPPSNLPEEQNCQGCEKFQDLVAQFQGLLVYWLALSASSISKF
jgi:hypothetical protein